MVILYCYAVEVEIIERDGVFQRTDYLDAENGEDARDKVREKYIRDTGAILNKILSVTRYE